MGNLLNRDALLAKEKLEIVKVDFEDGDFVYVRQMTGHERDTFENSLIKRNKDKKGVVVSFEQSTEDFRAKLAVQVLCDADGVNLLRPDDWSTLSRNMSAKKLESIVNVAQKINAISEEDKENLVKNSDADLVGNSSSDSVEN